MIMDIFSVKWTQVITVNDGLRQVSALPDRDFGEYFTASTLNQAEKAKFLIPNSPGRCPGLKLVRPVGA